jgi:hypothetical protein
MLIDFLCYYVKEYKDVFKMSCYVAVDPDNAENELQAKLHLVPFDKGDTEDVLYFVKQFWYFLGLKGKQDNGPALFRNAKLLLHGEALANFTDEEGTLVAAAGATVQTVPNFKLCLGQVICEVVPNKAGVRSRSGYASSRNLVQ